ncbi:MAG: glycosyltransferase family 2 protein, partial [Lachnospiraceae bacterium]|nr:glycosyltransferase family 2 protein [Lachnospiraceae bacterium]
MITISTCMIVKNEERLLARCLECVRVFSDEIIIVDTGSTDRTKEIAAGYTDKIYDFQWVNDFSAARNFSFSKATKEYIYVADADEVIDDENIRQILDLKKVLLPEIDIVQMYYANQLEFGTTYNYDKEYRPKLVKRLRQFIWQDPLHETIKLEPVIYDSDIA